ncbi:uncharacterized protein LOC111306143 [Durio zibethinus]|uniref:Uncharacterized protein LOC111306143 n=1 Tax=Durio zibethinus TaxID=66656 RepID=A0A6P6A448_DURZI|nr:uncharacterized protein LOC111306143 [Durio zibethinus]
MAPRRMKQEAQNPEMEKNLKVRVEAKRVKAEMGKIREDQEYIREEQRKIIGRFGEIERQCDQLKEETEMIMKQTVRTRIKVVLMFKILKAREGGDFIQAATLTHFLREFVARERANAGLPEVKDELP